MSDVRHFQNPMTNNPLDTTENDKRKFLELPLPSSAPNNAFMEEVNVIRVEGRYFCFDNREAGKRGAGLYKYVNTDGREITIQTGINGHPSILAYRILQSIFRQITLEGKPYPSRVVFTKREIGRLIGRDVFGGKDSQEITKALYQLQDTMITLKVQGEKNLDFADRFSLISRVRLVTERSEHNLNRHGVLDALAVDIHPAIMDSIRKGHIAIFNWGVLEVLEPVQAALYKRLYVHLSNLFEMNGHKKEALVFEKDYAAICAEWLGGLEPYRYKSAILRQLKPHLDVIQKTGMLRSYVVEERAKGQGFKICFRPGKGFFQDFEFFYRIKNVRQLQFKKTSDAAEYLEPIDVVTAFFEKAKGSKRDESTLDKADIDYARELISQFGKDDTIALIDYAVTSAVKTKFDMQSFRALKIYVSAWEANTEARQRSNQAQAIKAKETKELLLQADYETLKRRHVTRYLMSLSDDVRKKLEETAEELAKAENGGGYMIKAFATMKLRKMVLEKSPIPSFEDWIKSLE
jgi:hypothetical protein